MELPIGLILFLTMLLHSRVKKLPLPYSVKNEIKLEPQQGGQPQQKPQAPKAPKK